ncbi:trans-aconitate 2-methyltransferase [Thermomonospora catenispora]|uniref:trans-aconitate 2-methyltransferase n=1 Tax=Thermomonospora catenispora TaxID=2493090 RepID=UPI001122B2DC|nr:trans-aconitate 2-methyltransferase [Thermomonospora catenispora]TNY37236.1 trans-aconitate 2-methyltransferase [Thermomonospora catenispora]
MSRELAAARGSAVWDPAQYGVFGAERGRPFDELLARVPVRDPGHVVDLGCGSGERTVTLLRRWPGAVVEGLDSSPEMIAAARRAASAAGASVRFTVQDVRRWRPARPVDVIISNAVLHWIPGHEELLARWADHLAPGGCLAFQVPGNHAAPSHVLLRELCESPRWRDRLGGLLEAEPVRDAAGYLTLLADLGCAVDAWETTYIQVLGGDDAVLEWVKGTTLRPVLSALDPEAARDFLAEYGAALRAAYPPGPHGTVFPFRRIFVVARRPEDGGEPPP